MLLALRPPYLGLLPEERVPPGSSCPWKHAGQARLPRTDASFISLVSPPNLRPKWGQQKEPERRAVPGGHRPRASPLQAPSLTSQGLDPVLQSYETIAAQAM